MALPEVLEFIYVDFCFWKVKNCLYIQRFWWSFSSKIKCKIQIFILTHTQQCQSWKHGYSLLSPMMQLHLWISSFQNIQYCMKPWTRREGFRWKADFISSSIPFKMKAYMLQLSLGTKVWHMISKSPLPNSVNLWNPQTCGNEKNSPLIQVPRNAACKVIKFDFL